MFEFIKELFKKGDKKHVKKSKAETIGSIISYVLLFIVIAMLMVTIFTRYSGEIPFLFGYSFCSITTGSMVPVYNINDVVVVKSVEKSDIRPGEDILFINPNPADYARGIKFIVHRVRSVTEVDGEIAFVTYGVFKGDDDTRPAVDVKGVVSHKSLFLSVIFNIKNLIFIIFLLFLLYVAYTLSMRAYRIIINKETVSQEDANQINYDKLKEELLREIQSEMEKESITVQPGELETTSVIQSVQNPSEQIDQGKQAGQDVPTIESYPAQDKTDKNKSALGKGNSANRNKSVRTVAKNGKKNKR